MNQILSLAEKMRLAAFEASCKAMFSDFDDEEAPEILLWMGEEIALPDKFKVMPSYEPYSKTPIEIKKMLSSSTMALYDIMVVGASLIIEEGITRGLTVDDLDELMENTLLKS